MITRTILGATAAAFIAAGSLGASTGAASANGIYIGGNGFSIGYNDGYGNWNGHGHGGHKVCKPIYKEVAWKDRWGHWHKKVRLVDYKCWWTHGGHNWNDGYEGGYSGGWNNY
ncbi:MAG: hypothetical protein ABI399_12890 [Bauldia sp.]